jgi:hypothetical protein
MVVTMTMVAVVEAIIDSCLALFCFVRLAFHLQIVRNFYLYFLNFYHLIFVRWKDGEPHWAGCSLFLLSLRSVCSFHAFKTQPELCELSSDELRHDGGWAGKRSIISERA